MTVYIERDGKDEWVVRTAPQCMTDIIVQVARCDGEEQTLFAFHIGELIRTELEADGGIDGSYLADHERRAILARWADILELHARMIRIVLATPDFHHAATGVTEGGV
jgi:hypothetical protein